MTNDKKDGEHLASESGYDYVDKSVKPTTDSSGGDAIPGNETGGSGGNSGSGKGGNTGGRGGGAQGAGASSESEGSHGGS